MRIAIIGSGPAALFTAHFLKLRNNAAAVTLLERSNRLGGNLQYLQKPDGKTLDCGIKYLPLYGLSPGIYQNLIDFVESYGCSLIEIGNVFSVRQDQIVEGISLDIPKLRLLTELCRAFDHLYEASLCKDVLELTDRLLASETESLDEFGERNRIPLVARVLAMHADLFGFAINKQSSTAAYALLTRSHYSSALFYRILNKNRALKSAIRAAASTGLIRLKHRREFLEFIDQPARYGTYRSIAEGVGCLFERVKERNVDNVLLDHEVLGANKDTGELMVRNRGREKVLKFDQVFLATPYGSLKRILGIGNGKQNPHIDIRMTLQEVVGNRLPKARGPKFRELDLLGLFGSEDELGTARLNTQSNKVLGCVVEDASVLSLSYGAADDVAQRHRDQLARFFSIGTCRGVFEYQSPPLPHTDEIRHGVLRTLKALNESDSKVKITSQALFGASLFTLFNGLSESFSPKKSRFLRNSPS